MSFAPLAPLSAARFAGQGSAGAAALAYDWTGFYAGGNVGYGAGSGHSGETLTFPNGTQFSGETFTLTPAGALGGLQAWRQCAAWELGDRR